MIQAAGDTMLNALAHAIDIVVNRGPDVYLSWPEKVSLHFAEMLVRGDDRWIESVYQYALNTEKDYGCPVISRVDAPAPLEDDDLGMPQINWDVPDVALPFYAPDVALDDAPVPDADDRALDASDSEGIDSSAAFLEDSDQESSEEEDEAIRPLDDNDIYKHEFSDDTRRFLYRVRGCPGRKSAKDLVLKYVGVKEALYRYWTIGRHEITNKARLEKYLALQGPSINNKFNSMLWPQLGGKGYRRLLRAEENGELREWVERRRDAARKGEGVMQRDGGKSRKGRPGPGRRGH
ncbi:MAG: hypothetical protein H9W81_15535 [Enterococcus sp.]|nr:hypothetical protein [Enterococcus sp.]